MSLKVNRQDDLDAIFGKFAEMNIDDDKRDKFLKHKKNDKDKKKKEKKHPEQDRP
ncbi:SPJ_0845 family protein [Lentilactobacillus raoultii]|uniref:SPJ_0845 family protein n=1 Tax=Lentilactobacillus raoultii TaxID=1987503 RepID=A0ABW3PK37_9LACO|nr:SPJ_0845 family protein [Lentilactobacillus raoultii]